ncbi:MAG: glucans biosynthesis glucosyltransferase MdoH [Pseudomonadota bacterium]
MQPVSPPSRSKTLTRHLWYRALYVVLVIATLVGGTAVMVDIVATNGATAASVTIAVLFGVTFAHLSASFWTAALGFLVRLGTRDPVRSVCDLDPGRDRPLRLRTAVVMPVYNEPSDAVLARLAAVHASLAAQPEADRFEFHLLSDSTDAAVAHREQTLVEQFNRDRTSAAPGPLQYRRRADNVGRKVGNLDDFCARESHRFEAMVVLDADSVMSGRTLVRLARLLQANPRVGIIQTVTLPANQQTLFARMMQFAGRLQAEMVATGAALWQGPEGNYFGHNAIIRLAPFVAHCRLPELPGRGALAGPILSHDFVEAAFMRRAGYEVRNLPDGDGSFEELPSNVLDYARRDRRWCQGNLQHLRLLAEPGLHWVSRLHFVLGALAYLVSPLWLGLLAFGLGQICARALLKVPVFVDADPVFKPWPVLQTQEAVALLAVTLAMVVAPKLMGLVLALRSSQRRRQFGGTARLVMSSLAELVFSTLVAPVLMVHHSLHVLGILSGLRVGWVAQPRGARDLGLRESVLHSTVHLSLGAALLGVVLSIVPGHLVWVMPVLAGLLLSVPLVAWSSRATPGDWLRERRWLATPEELAVPVELAASQTGGMPRSAGG